MRKSVLVWIILLSFGFASMPEIGLAKESKQTGKIELTKKKKKSKKKHSRKNKTNRKRKGSKNKRSAGKTKYSRTSKYSKHSKYSKKSKYSKNKRSRRHSSRTYVKRYSPQTNSGSVEYRNYKRNSDETTSQDIEKIAPQKEIRKEPKKEDVK